MLGLRNCSKCNGIVLDTTMCHRCADNLGPTDRVKRDNGREKARG